LFFPFAGSHLQKILYHLHETRRVKRLLQNVVDTRRTERPFVHRIVATDKKNYWYAPGILPELFKFLGSMRSRQGRIENQELWQPPGACGQSLGKGAGLYDLQRMPGKGDFDDLLDRGRIIRNEHSMGHDENPLGAYG
jgi:hypothetical protein